MIDDKTILKMSTNLEDDIIEEHMGGNPEIHCKVNWEECETCWHKFVTELYKAGYREGRSDVKCKKHGWTATKCDSCLEELEKEINKRKKESKGFREME